MKTGTFQFVKLTTWEEMIQQYPLLQQLTPNLTFESYAQYLRDMIPHNYFQVSISERDISVGLSGYWIATKLYCGKYLEIDNFIIDATHRSKGIGSALLDWLEAEALRNGCVTMMLDAYVENFRAHQFYYRNHFIARGFHYIRKINATQEG